MKAKITFVAVSLLISIAWIGPLIMAQPALNCEAGAGGGLSVLGQYSSWSAFAKREASVICNFAFGNSMGMAITVDYRCTNDADKVWNGLTQGWRQKKDVVAMGPVSRRTDPLLGADIVRNDIIHIRKVNAERGFQSFVGQFPQQEQFLWRWDERTIVTIVMMSSQSIGITTDARGVGLRGVRYAQTLESTVYELVNKHYAPIQCPVFKIIRKTPNRVEIRRPQPIEGARDDELYLGDVVRLTRKSGDKIAPFIEVEWLLEAKPRWRGIAVFRGLDSFYDEFTVQMFPGQTGWPTLMGTVLNGGAKKSIGWILKNVVGGIAKSILMKTSSTQQDLIFMRLKSLVIFEPTDNGSRLLTLEGQPDLFYNKAQSMMTVNAGAQTRIQNGTPSNLTAFDSDTLDRWWSPYLDDGESNDNPPPPASGNLKVDRHLIASDVDKDPCCTPIAKTNFSPRDLRAISYVTFSNYENALGTPLLWEFYTPQGDLFGSLPTELENQAHWVWIDIANESAATMPGQWTVKFYTNNQLQFEDRFTISGAPSRPVPTCTWTGTCDTSTGSRMSLRQRGNNVSGNYTNGGVLGNIDGSVRGKTLSGEWGEPPFGAFETGDYMITFSNGNCDSFEGVWRFSSETLWREWTGARISNTPLPLCAPDTHTSSCVSINDISLFETNSAEISAVEILDGNHSGFLDDAEIRQAFHYWVTGQPLPGGNQTIDDEMMKKFVQAWILKAPLRISESTDTVSLPQAMAVRALSLSSPDPTQRTLNVSGQNIASVELWLYDLNGQLLLKSQNRGSQLRFSLRNPASQPLANGVYLYTVTARGTDGASWRSGVRKMMILR